jgi:hypothetical protein
MSDLLHTTVVLFAIPFLAILVPAILTWARDLDATARRIRRVDEQSKVITFWENWSRAESSIVPAEKSRDYEAEALISSLRRTVRRELADAGRGVLRIYKLEESRSFHRFPYTYLQFRRYRARLPWMRRPLLLYRAPNPRSVSPKALFHVATAEIVLGPIIKALELRIKEPRSLPLLPGDTFLRAHPAVAVPLLILTILGIWLASRQAAVSRENDKSNYVRDQILFRYRFHGSREE